MIKTARKPLLFLLLITLLLGVFISSILMDSPVEFSDSNLELAVREKINHFYKPIFRSQLLGIVELDLSGSDIYNIDGIEHFRNLEILNLRDNHINDVSPLESLTHLRILDLGYNRIIDLETSNFERITELQLIVLNLDHNLIEHDAQGKIRLSNIELLKHFSSLEVLSLDDNHISNISPLADLTQLKELVLIENQLTELSGLEKLINLESLNLRENKLEDVSAISAIESLKYLNLHSNPNIRDISPLGGLINLETLILRNVPVGDQIVTLENLSKLQRLNIRNCSISDPSVLVSLMESGALQDKPHENIYAYLDILENNIPNDPRLLRDFRPFWVNIHVKYPFLINDAILDPPIFSFNGGFYRDSIDLELHSNLSNVSIHYTLDGSNPTEDSPVYTSPLLIENLSQNEQQHLEARVVRAKLFQNDGFDASPIITNTYFIGYSHDIWPSLPVVSLVTDPENFFDPEFGIYADGNFYNRGKKWERPIHLAIFKADGTLDFSQNAHVRIHGGASRNLPQKSLRFYGENNYGAFEPVDYEFFPGYSSQGTGDTLTQYKTFIFRNSGNDWQHTMFRDALVQELYRYTSQDIQAFRPVNVFLNGHYWGIYNIRERQDEYYLENHYQINPDDVTIHQIETYGNFYGQPPESNAFLSLLDFIRNNDIQDDEIYEYIGTQIDILNFIDNQIIYLYSANGDWLTNNVKFWRKNVEAFNPHAPAGHDGRWRWMVVDMDYAFRDVEANILSVVTTDTEKAFLMSALIKNPQFRMDFITQFADHLNTSFEPSRVVNEINRIEAMLESDMAFHINRWDTMNNSKDQWHQNVDVMRQFALQRPDIVRNHLMEEFGLNATVDINVSTNLDHGYVRVNSVDILDSTPGVQNPSSWSGIYFTDIPITLTAFPKPGYRFSHWEGIEIVGLTESSIIFTPLEDVHLSAVFEPSSSD